MVWCSGGRRLLNVVALQVPLDEVNEDVVSRMTDEEKVKYNEMMSAHHDY